MRDILFLAHRLPWPPDRGDKIRSYNLLRHLSRLARVHVLAFAEDMREIASADALRSMVASIHVEWRSHIPGPSVLRALVTGQAASVAMFASRSMQRHVDRVLEREDIGTILAFSGQMAQFVPDRTKARFLMDFVDVDSEKYTAYSHTGPFLLRWLYQREARLLGRYERAIAAKADQSLFVSEAEATLFRQLSGLGTDKVLAIENGIDLEYFKPNADFQRLGSSVHGPGPMIVFTGQMNYRPNIDAVIDFAQKMLPVLRHVRSDIRFAIVGRNPPAEVEALAALPGVIVTGEVPDVRPWIAAADVVVAPLRIARGIQNKVLEAMAMARPVVISSAAAEGINGQSDRDFFVADGDAAATTILALLSDAERAAKLGHRARARMEEYYHWDARLAALDGLLAP
jgi:sugar transferase (PEP-CTERM/EpsH1 system associated)